VITVDLRLNEPRYASWPGHHEGQEKALDVTSLDALGRERRAIFKDRENRTAGAASESVMVKDVAELVGRSQEGRV